jgi:hypothetical protein
VVVAAGADVFLSKEAGKSAGADAGAAPARLQNLEQQDQQAPKQAMFAHQEHFRHLQQQEHSNASRYNASLQQQQQQQSCCKMKSQKWSCFSNHFSCAGKRCL